MFLNGTRQRLAGLMIAGVLCAGLTTAQTTAQSAAPGVAQDATAQSVLAQGAASRNDSVEVDFLLNYYDQDGDNSPVTGGIGTEDLQVISPLVLVRWAVSEDWTLSTDVGIDGITSASTDNIDSVVSSASRQDNRTFTFVTATRQMEDQAWSLGLGFSKEYDYSSVNGRLRWSKDFNSKNTNLSVALGHYSDTVELYDIDGIVQGEDDRTTTDVSIALTQVVGPKTVVSAELSHSAQSGFLSTPFQEVILTDGSRVAERLPDSRGRSAVGLSVNHAFSDKVVQRVYYRFYDDDFGIQAHTVEAETHFRLPFARESWVYPILRFHSQTGSDYFGLPSSFTGSESFFTADRDLSEFDSEKFGVGLRLGFARKGSGLRSHLRSFETRLASYSRDDGFEAISLSLALGLSF